MLRSNVASSSKAENRRGLRQRAFLRGKLSYLDGAISFDCVVTQISSTGAKISLKEGVSLPERFRIEIAVRQIDSKARLVRRDAEGAAIAFVDDDELVEANLPALKERLRMMEAENKMLRANCDALAAQLERSKASY